MSRSEPNIFRISSTAYGPEDRFTAHLGYLFDNLPALGQEWLNHLRAQAGLPPDRFRRGRKHAQGLRATQPDFLIEGDAENILCEHKLDAPLSERQLESYLAFADDLTDGHPERKRTRLAFVSASIANVAAEVCESDTYVKPSKGQLVYFRWEELYPIVASKEDRLAREFAAYMEELGLRYSNTREWSDLFVSTARFQDFAAQWRDAVTFFEGLPATTVIAKNSPGMQVRKPVPWLHNLYFKPQRRPPYDAFDAFAGPYIWAAVSVSPNDCYLSADRAAPQRLEANGHEIHSQATAHRIGGSGEVWCHEYFAPLDSVLHPDPDEMRKRLLVFARSVYDHVVTTRANAEGGAEARL